MPQPINIAQYKDNIYQIAMADAEINKTDVDKYLALIEKRGVLSVTSCLFERAKHLNSTCM